MEEKTQISVIIPVYNVEKYLDRCVQSVLHQTIADIEIILVDDGSPDGSPRMCDEYSELDTRVKVIHKRNGGLASARNAGLKMAAGEYIFFLDSDDWLDLDGLEMLYSVAKQYNVDFVRFRAIRSCWPDLPENAPGRVEEVREMEGGYYDLSAIREKIYPKAITTTQLTMGAIVAAWSSLYKREFLYKNNLFFNEQIKFSEDMVFSANVVLNAESFYYIEDACVYHYFYNPASISKSFRKERWDSCKAIIESFDKEILHNPRFNYDFSSQFNHLKWFCILLGLKERKYISDFKTRYEYCKKIMEDEIVRTAKLSFATLDVSLRQKIIMILIKCNCVAAITLI